MQLRVSPESLLEWAALQSNQVPLPLLHAQVLPVLCKAVLEAVEQGIFEAVENGHHTPAAIALACQLNAKATRQLLGVLTSIGYFEVKNKKYFLTAMSKKWILDPKTSVKALIVYNNRVVWPWLDTLGHYLKTGQGIEYHDSFTDNEWALYQSAMHAAATAEANEFSKRACVPPQAERMLDIGGAHGLHSVALCRKHPLLNAVIIDLPEAIEKGMPLLEKEKMGDRVVYQPGNILHTELPDHRYDLVLMSSLAHHLTEDQNREVCYKVARALKPGGIFIINEFVRPDPTARPELVGSSTDLFFGLTSTSGNWSVEEIQDWQKNAGLAPLKVSGYHSLPGRFLVAAQKN